MIMTLTKLLERNAEIGRDLQGVVPNMGLQNKNCMCVRRRSLDLNPLLWVSQTVGPF